MGKALILWLLGVPFTLLIVLWFFSVSFDEPTRREPAGPARVS